MASRVEIDVRRCLDGALVLSHDPDLGGRIVAETSWRDLSSVELGSGHRPVRLEDVLEAVPDTPLDIEIKNNPAEPGYDPELSLADDVVRLARSHDIVSSFHWPTLGRVRELRPELPTGLLFDRAIPGDAAIEHGVETGHGAIAPEWSLVSERIIDRAHDHGLDVIAWTVDEPATALRLASWGIDAIITNDPGAMVAVLGRRPPE